MKDSASAPGDPDQEQAGPTDTVTRRALARAAWAVPVILVAASTPAHAAS